MEARDRHERVLRQWAGPPTPGTASVRSGGLAELLDVILDKGIVIDAWARVSLVAIELLTIEARVVVASVETYLRYAEAIGLTALAAPPPTQPSLEDQQDGRGPGRPPPSVDEVYSYLADHVDGVGIGELAAYFDAPRRELSPMVDELVSAGRVRHDDEHHLYFAADEED